MWYSFSIRFYTDSREVKKENDWEGGETGGREREREGERKEKISLFSLLTPSPIDFWVDLILPVSLKKLLSEGCIRAYSCYSFILPKTSQCIANVL